MLLFLPDYLESVDIIHDDNGPVQYLRVEFSPENRLSHRDFLGSIMGMGVSRESIGDLLVTDSTCDMVVLKDIKTFLRSSMESAGRAKLKISSIEANDLRLPKTESKLIRDTVSTLRLDSVAASGFSISRRKAADLISAGKVSVNWQERNKPDQLVREGDTISARGMGKFVLEQVGGLSKKGRTTVVLRRLI